MGSIRTAEQMEVLLRGSVGAARIVVLRIHGELKHSQPVPLTISLQPRIIWQVSRLE